MQTVYINGKFTAQRTTGVQRVATQWLSALDALFVQRPDPRRWLLLCPPGGTLPAHQRIQARHVGPAGLPLHAWEQAVLPWAARRGRLLSLAGSAPWLGRGAVCTLHDAAVFDHPEAYTPAFVRWYAALFRHQARRAAALLTVSAWSRSRLALHLGLPEAAIDVVPNGGDHLDGVAPDEAVLDRHGLRGRRYLLAVGSANPTKNHAGLLAAWSLLSGSPAAQGVLLVLVGGTLATVFAPDAAPTEAPGVVRTGPLGDAALKALYGQAQALVFPSLYEGFGLPPLEAMSCGCPVAAARAASIPEVCGDAALYFDPASPADIAAALGRLMAEPALRRRLAEAGRRRVRDWPWRNSAVALRAVMERLA